jgi:tRNA 2-thiouridine synthesizing protein A
MTRSRTMSRIDLDLSGLKCPLPALKTRKALMRLAAGDELVVTATDPMSVIDIPNMARETGDVLEAQSTSEDRLVFHIRKT